MTDRGVSEVVGFILIFSLVTISVGSVYVFGFDGLQDARDGQQLENVERAFDVFEDNMDDLVGGEAPNRATEFKLYDATIEVGEPTRITTRLTNVGNAPSYSVQAYPVVYRSETSPSTTRYVLGSVIRQDRGGELFRSEPGFVFRKDGAGPSDPRTAVLSFVQTRSRGPQRAAGSETVLVRGDLALNEVLTARREASSEVTADPDGDSTDETTTDPDGDSNPEYRVELSVKTNTTRVDLWETYLDDELTAAYPSLSDPCSVSGDTVTCTFPIERLYVTASRIDVNIES